MIARLKFPRDFPPVLLPRSYPHDRRERQARTDCKNNLSHNGSVLNDSRIFFVSFVFKTNSGEHGEAPCGAGKRL
jgi:hypothetical protein